MAGTTMCHRAADRQPSTSHFALLAPNEVEYQINTVPRATWARTTGGLDKGDGEGGGLGSGSGFRSCEEDFQVERAPLERRLSKLCCTTSCSRKLSNSSSADLWVA